MNNIDDLIEFNKRFIKFESLFIYFRYTETHLHMIVDKHEFPQYLFLLPCDFEEIMDAYEKTIIKQIGLNLKYINEYIYEYKYREDVYEMIFCIKESLPQLSKSIDSMIEDESNFTNIPEFHNIIKKDLIIFNNIELVNRI